MVPDCFRKIGEDDENGRPRGGRFVTIFLMVMQLFVSGLKWAVIKLKRDCVQVLELAENAARDNKKTSIVLRHIQLAVRNDEELSKLLEDVTIVNGDVIPNIHNLLLPKKVGGSSKPSADED
ncbi:hypothetical protein RHMOL_Rhmol03G0145800 [Rhododendron molle]|uniref:Uncharacterized protein n=1 Tax=Rhododendron molle TaxID=49168 RepID=A0ACC0PGK0_RHOML|nr:hypothetical protein RHMOL_Rhmol03G0145800 [Rhododendron molle]